LRGQHSLPAEQTAAAKEGSFSVYTLGIFEKVYECQDHFPITASHGYKPAKPTDNTTKLLSLIKQKEESLPAKIDFADRLFWFGHWPGFKSVGYG